MAIIDKIQLSGTVYTIGNETTTAVTSASTDNEIPTAKAVYDAIPQGGGGKAIEAGRGISITTGETADTVSFNIPISAGTNALGIVEGAVQMGEETSAKTRSSLAIGYRNWTNGQRSVAGGALTHTSKEGAFAFGEGCAGDANYSMAFGGYVSTSNYYEFSCGMYNKSNTSSTTADKTLFSVGNGTSSSARHNAFEIRQNGDIYISKDGQDVKLQDQLGGGGGSITIDPSLDSGSTNPVANSAITNAIDSKQNVLNTGYYGGVSSTYMSSGEGTWEFVSLKKFVNSGNTVTQNSDDKIYFTRINGKKLVSAWKPTSIPLPNLSLVETSAITTSVTSSSTDSEIPSAKAVYEMVGNINTILESI